MGNEIYATSYHASVLPRRLKSNNSGDQVELFMELKIIEFKGY